MSCQTSVTTHQRVLEHAPEKIPGWWNMPPGGGIAKWDSDGRLCWLEGAKSDMI